MYHLALQGDHYQMGVTQGTLFKRNGIRFPLRLDSFQLEHGRRSERILRERFPEACAEMRGVSDAIGMDFTSFAAWMLCMGCCMYNLEENVPVEVRGCTAFAYAKGGRLIYGRNNDLPPYLRDGSKSVLYAPRGGNSFNLTTSSFINGEEGLNEYGLAVAMTFVMTRLERIEPGLNACFVVRYLLERARNAEEAISLLTDLPVASNCNLLLADRSGRMVVAECAPALKRIREAEVRHGDSIVCAVNSFTSEEMKPYDDSDGNDYRSAERYSVVMDGFRYRLQGDVIEGTKWLLKGDYGFMCQYDREPNFETVWSSIFDLEHLRILRAEGDPRKTEWIADDRLRDVRTGG